MTYQGHSTASPGIQNHPVGDTFPCIVVGFGDGTYGVELGAHKCHGLGISNAYAIAIEVAGVIREQGYTLGVSAFIEWRDAASNT